MTISRSIHSIHLPAAFHAEHALARWIAVAFCIVALAWSAGAFGQTRPANGSSVRPAAAPPVPLDRATAVAPAPTMSAPAAPTNSLPLMAASAPAGSMASQSTTTGEGRDTLGEGDTVHITVFQNPDLTTDARVSQGGTIRVPMVGEVPVGGLTPSAAEAQIAQRLEQGKFVVRPQVNLNVTKVRSRQVTVLGQVARPGRYALEDPSSGVMDILALAGGIVATGDENVLVVTSRNGQVQKQEVNVEGMLRNGDLKSNIQLANGDTIYVKSAPVFYIYGEVQRAGAYPLKAPMTVMQAIATGGGVTPRGTERGLKVRRQGPDGSLQTLDVGLADRLVANDVVYVKESLF